MAAAKLGRWQRPKLEDVDVDYEVRLRTVASLPELREAVAAHKNGDRTTVLRVRCSLRYR
jgi:hypothetical protein